MLLLHAVTRISVRIVQRYLPDPFLFAILLTFVVFGFGWAVTSAGPLEMIRYWGDGFWGLLEFSMQMVLILVTGHVLAQAPPVRRVLLLIAGSARTPAKAVMLTTFISALASWISWGFGLVVGALVAREVARKVQGVDYRVLVAGAYAGFIVWHAGISGSIPLKIATDNSFGVTVPASETIFASFSLIPALILIFTFPLFMARLQPRREERVLVDPDALEESRPLQLAAEEVAATPAQRLERSRWISMSVGGMGLVYIATFFYRNGGQLDLNIVNFSFLIMGLMLHQTPRRYLSALAEAIREAGGIVIQFPFYAGIMGMMSLSGLGKIISEWLIAFSNETTFPLFAFLSAGLLNIFVPSGGGQWAVQGPIMLSAGQALGVDPARTAMAVAWGDAWTNLVQPFWALPLLAIARLNARDIMGFCLLALFYSGLVIGFSLMFL